LCTCKAKAFQIPVVDITKVRCQAVVA
jgi:hypothetical protein